MDKRCSVFWSAFWILGCCRMAEVSEHPSKVLRGRNFGAFEVVLPRCPLYSQFYRGQRATLQGGDWVVECLCVKHVDGCSNMLLCTTSLSQLLTAVQDASSSILLYLSALRATHLIFLVAAKQACGR